MKTTNWFPLQFNQSERIGIIFLLLQIIKDGNIENSILHQSYLNILVSEKLGITNNDINIIKKISNTLQPHIICNELINMTQAKKYALLIMLLKMAQINGQPSKTVKNKIEQFVLYFNLPHTEVEISSIQNYKEIGCYYTTSYSTSIIKDIEMNGFSRDMIDDEL